jgi:Photosynthetic reaction centre cytochrome C subunit
MKRVALLLLALSVAAPARAQASRKFPPDSLKVLPARTPVIQVIAAMRNFSGDLGVRCQYCHVGNEGQPLDQFDFASDAKRPKLVAREMMRMVAEINRRLDSLPAGDGARVQVTCNTCHREVSRPIPLSTLIFDEVEKKGLDSAVSAYNDLRRRYYGKSAYDFGEFSLNSAAFRLGRARKFTEAFALLTLNEQNYPNSAAISLFRGNVNLMKGDTVAAEAAFRESLRRDPQFADARERLRAIGKTPSLQDISHRPKRN